MATKYQVIWHEENDAGVPKHVMGSSELFDTELEAKQWIDSAAAAVYLWHGDVRHFIYWIAAATLTATVTY